MVGDVVQLAERLPWPNEVLGWILSTAKQTNPTNVKIPVYDF